MMFEWKETSRHYIVGHSKKKHNTQCHEREWLNEKMSEKLQMIGSHHKKMVK